MFALIVYGSDGVSISRVVGPFRTRQRARHYTRVKNIKDWRIVPMTGAWEYKKGSD